ncbi:hypothetical protein BU26DRAFT_577870 [Trematosphaeria pertusa]|uniref:Uncharacterized protein n=1 Tax=Trematosphaeria pertusa TaxID=390896 RepID=A0A6A6I6T5_9PLEO|nr:uncharacterized protein BU26DRAFT_577870 [Trematosphaeria pertusa]KAF2246264.1 hypothetical protein BU26DRAFT_577870 [Trematosphaeria pertusa]
MSANTEELYNGCDTIAALQKLAHSDERYRTYLSPWLQKAQQHVAAINPPPAPSKLKALGSKLSVSLLKNLTPCQRLVIEFGVRHAQSEIPFQLYHLTQKGIGDELELVPSLFKTIVKGKDDKLELHGYIKAHMDEAKRRLWDFEDEGLAWMLDEDIDDILHDLKYDRLDRDRVRMELGDARTKAKRAKWTTLFLDHIFRLVRVVENCQQPGDAHTRRGRNDDEEIEVARLLLP